VSVGHLVNEGERRALGSDLAAHVLDDHGVALIEEMPRNLRHEGKVGALVVRHSDQECR
jgi:hypothetical protein